VQLLAALLLLLDLDGPETLDALRLVGAGSVAVTLMRVDLGDAQREQRHGQQLECVFEGGAVGDLGEEGVLLAGFLVGWGLQGAEGALDWVVSLLGGCL